MNDLLRLGRSLLLVTLLLSSAIAAGDTLAQARSTFVDDGAFGRGGLVTGEVGPIESSATLSPKALAVDAQGRVIVGAATWTEWKVWRILRNGELDASFGDGGEVTVSYWGGSHGVDLANLASGVIRPDGRILLVGYKGSTLVGNGRKGLAKLIMKQLMPDGSPDQSFGQDGGVSFGTPRGATGVALRPDGRFVVAAFKQISQTGRTDDAALYSFSTDGTLERGFGGGENVDSVNVLGAPGKPSEFFDVDVLANGRILLAGVFQNALLVMKLRKDGSRDRSFGKGGRVVLRPDRGTRWLVSRSMERDRKGRIVVAGYGGPADSDSGTGYGLLARFGKNGRLDHSFGSKGVVRLYATGKRGARFTRLYGVAIDSKSGIWAVGSAGQISREKRHAIGVRFLSNGKKDPRFFNHGVLNVHLGKASVGTSIVRAGRKIYLSGRYDRGDQECFFVRRFKPSR